MTKSKNCLLNPVLLVLLHCFIKEVRVDLHEELQGIVNHAMNGTTSRVSFRKERGQWGAHRFQWALELL